MADTIFTLTEQLQKIATEGVELARRTSSDTDLTPEGRANRFANWGRQQKWGTRIEEVEQRANRAFDRTAKAAADARSKVIGKPSTAEATLAELRFARRADSIRAALADRDRDGVRDLILNADPAELPLAVEEAQRFYREQATGHQQHAGLQSLEAALRERDPEYGQAAALAEQADVARGKVAQLVDGARRATTEIDVPQSELFWKLNADVTEAGDDIAGLTA